MGEAFIKALVDGLKDNIYFDSKVGLRLRLGSKKLPAPTLQTISNNGIPDFARGRNSESNLSLVCASIIQQHPVGGPVTTSVFFERKKLGVSFQS